MFSDTNVKRLLLWASVLSLIALLVLLGAAAKHSQFDHSGHGTHYLAKAVKMSQLQVQSNCTVAAPAAALRPLIAFTADIPPANLPFYRPAAVLFLTPLLI